METVQEDLQVGFDGVLIQSRVQTIKRICLDCLLLFISWTRKELAKFFITEHILSDGRNIVLFHAF